MVSDANAFKDLESACALYRHIPPHCPDASLSPPQELELCLILERILERPLDQLNIPSLSAKDMACLLELLQYALDHDIFRIRQNNHRLRRLTQRLLITLARSSNQLPGSLLIHGVTRRGDLPTVPGGFSDVYRGSYRGKEVALKRMRVFSLTPGSELKRIVKVLYREAIIWRSLSHENILPLVGIDAGSQSPCPCILVSPWMDNGNVNDYVRSQALSNQQVVQLLREVSCALGYLHDRQIVHGDIRGGNILVDENGHAKLMDFGLAFASEMTQSTVASGSPRWMAPELHDPKSFGLASGVKLPPTDVYGFAFTCLEVYTGQRPFPELSEISALIAVIAGQRPDRPSAEECGRFFSDRFWCLLEKCWSHQPEARPSSQDVSEQNIPETRLTAFIPPEQIPSPDLSDAVTITSKLPMDTFLPYSDTYKGELFNKFGQRTSVTCRAMRLYARGPSEVVLIGQVIKREVLFWPQLAHVNVVPFLGTCNIDTHLSFVYPFYELGTLGAYIRNYPKADRQSLLRDVAQGMAFIHSQNLVHGDLTPDSVLVDDTKTARLFNFGFTGVEGDRTPTPLRAIRYMAPETYGIDPRGVPVPHHRMKASDVYAFGILAYTVLMGRVPWPRLTELQVFARIFHGERPENPDGRIPLSLWKLIQNCWAEDPYARPTMSAIVQQLNTNTRSSLSRWRQSLF